MISIKLVFILLMICAAVQCKMIQMCGMKLALTLTRICAEESFKAEDTEAPLTTKVRHNSFDYHDTFNKKGFAMKRNYQQGLVERCCYKACHIKDFIKYCP